MRLIEWQYYPRWHLSFNKVRNDYDDRAWYEYWITIGPIQTRWRGKSWNTRLFRSKEYSDRAKRKLLEELISAKYTHTNT